MLKGLVWFLIFGAVFFMGMHAASGDKNVPEETNALQEERIPEQSALPVLPEQNMQQEQTEPAFYPVMDTPEGSGGILTNQTASFMERAVTGLYEMIVGILYSIANLLF